MVYACVQDSVIYARGMLRTSQGPVFFTFLKQPTSQVHRSDYPACKENDSVIVL